KDMRLELGKTLYAQNCQACHQAEGQGIKGAFPPLAKSDYLNADVNRSIGVVAHGLEGQIKVNGEVYNSTMPKLKLTDEEIANVMTYVMNNWGNKGGEISLDQVKKAKASYKH
ncbi:MAG TPA: cytochrome c, partial [Adhaeribacter sp.]|nr:cytochrome c [Adhaeribacter sp.]